MRKRLSAGWLALALLVGCGSAVVNPVTGQAERSVMDEREEVVQGRQAHQQVLQEYGVYPDADLQAYVNAMGQRLAAQSHRTELEWHFTVLDSPEINAFALPGGYVYVTRGIMAYLQSDADLAGVIGHEIGHVTARHGAQRATRQQDAGLGVLAASVLGMVLESQGISGAGRLAGELSQVAAAGYVASYSREQELQADGLGAEYLARNHYDPRNMVDVIRALKNQERFSADRAREQGRASAQRGNWLASHPSNDERLERIADLAAQYHDSGYGDEGRGPYLQRVRGMVYGESPAQGLTRGEHFYHPGLGFTLRAPPGWQFHNASDRLTLTNPAGDAALVLRLLPEQAGQSHADVVRAVFKPAQGRLEPVVINGMQATRFFGVRAGGQGQSVEATVISGPGQQIYLLQYGARDARSLDRSRAQMRQAEGSLRAMSAQDRRNAKEWRIGLAPYPAGGFAQLAKTSPLPGAEDRLRLLNGYYGGGEPRRGDLVKVVVER